MFRHGTAQKSTLELLENQKCLFVCSAGGHLTQLSRIAAVRGASPESLWVTPRSPQSERLLAGRRAEFTGYVGPRDYKGLLNVARTTFIASRRESFDVVVSTGAGPAVFAFLLNFLLRRKLVFIESISRVEGPSLSGRIINRIPGVHRFAQHPRWANDRWRYDETLMDSLAPATIDSRGTGTVLPKRILVLLGTIRPYRFDRLVDKIKGLLLDDIDVTWQLGCTTRTDLPGTVHELIAHDEICRLMSEADLVIAHAGVGVALEALESGTPFILVPRSAEYGEHVDEHQDQIAQLFARNLLGVRRTPDTLEWQDLLLHVDDSRVVTTIIPASAELVLPDSEADNDPETIPSL